MPGWRLYPTMAQSASPVSSPVVIGWATPRRDCHTDLHGLSISVVFVVLGRHESRIPTITEFLEAHLNALNPVRSAVQDFGIFQSEDSNVVSVLSFLTELAAIHDGVIACFLEKFCHDAGRYIALPFIRRHYGLGEGVVDVGPNSPCFVFGAHFLLTPQLIQR